MLFKVRTKLILEREFLIDSEAKRYAELLALEEIEVNDFNLIINSANITEELNVTFSESVNEKKLDTSEKES